MIGYLSLACSSRHKCMHMFASHTLIPVWELSTSRSMAADAATERKGEVGSSSGVVATSTSVPHASQKDANQGFIRGRFDVTDFPPEAIRNFCIIAHIDHGGTGQHCTIHKSNCYFPWRYIITTSFLNPDEDPHVLAEIPLFLPAAAAASQLLTSLFSRYFSHLRQVHVS